MRNPSVPEPPNDDELQESVIRDYGWQFEGPFYTEAPVPRQKYVGIYDGEVERLRNHLLTTVIIRDHFDENHSARRAFLTEQGLSGFVKRKNKLKGNNLNGIACCLDMIMENLEGKPIHESLKAIWTLEISNQVEPPSYNAMTPEQKIAIVRKLDDVIYRFLAVLAQ